MNYRGTIAYRSGTLGAQIYEGFAASFINAARFLDCQLSIDGGGNYQNPGIYFMRGQSCILHEAAHQIAMGFQGDWFIMLDSDHVFESNVFAEMMDTFLGQELDVLVGWTQKRQPPYTPTAYKYDFNPHKSPEPVKLDGMTRQFLVPIDAAGAAALMVRRSVIERIMKELGERPFQPRWKFEGERQDGAFLGVNPNLYGDGDDESDPFFWEDFSFFWRCKLLGIECFLAPWIRFPHLEVRLVTPDMEQKVPPGMIFGLASDAAKPGNP